MICGNVLIDEPFVGPQVSATRPALQEASGEHDTVYVQGLAERDLGERWQIVRNTGPIRHPATGDSVGNVLEVLAVAEVVASNAETSMLRIVGSCREVEIGDYVRALPAGELPEEWPRLPTFDASFLVTADEADAFLVLGAIESMNSREDMGLRQLITPVGMYAERDLVMIDQGAENAWQLADIAMIYRDRVYGRWSALGTESFTRPVGRGVIVRADTSSAILQIVDSVEEIHIGDRARKAGSALDYVNHPPSIVCRVEQDRVRTGESVRLTAEVSDPDGDATTVSWQASAGALSASVGISTTWTAAGVGAGEVVIRATVDDGREGSADCELSMAVAPAPGAAALLPETEPEPEILSFMCPEFPAGRTAVDNRCKAVLDEVALRLRQNPLGTAEMVGHADTSGADEVNQVASSERAEKARDYLVETHGIDATRITTTGAGSSQPIADNATEEGRLRNRRVEIRVTLPGVGTPDDEAR